METSKKILGKINTQRCSVTLMQVYVKLPNYFTAKYTCYLPARRSAWKYIFPRFQKRTNAKGRGTLLRLCENFFFSTGILQMINTTDSGWVFNDVTIMWALQQKNAVLSSGKLLVATIVRWHFELNTYMFRIYTVMQKYG
jgi:hypothetical protein